MVNNHTGSREKVRCKNVGTKCINSNQTPQVIRHSRIKHDLKETNFGGFDTLTMTQMHPFTQCCRNNIASM